MNCGGLSAQKALERLKEGNERYLRMESGKTDTPSLRKRLVKEGQRPYAVVLTCSDSRVVPERIFSAGLGELFVIRTAGNIADEVGKGSIAYAVRHLGCKLILVLGHTECGAVGAALSKAEKEEHPAVTALAKEIAKHLCGETDPAKAAKAHADATARELEALFSPDEGVRVLSALYDTESGFVTFLEAIE